LSGEPVHDRVQFLVGHPGSLELGQPLLEERAKHGVIVDIELGGVANLRRNACSGHTGVAAHLAAAKVEALRVQPDQDLFGSTEGSISPSVPTFKMPRLTA